MTIRFWVGSTSPITFRLWALVTGQWMIIIDYLQEEFHSGCSRSLGSATGIIVIIQLLYVLMCLVSLYNPLSTEGRLGVPKTFRRRSKTTYEHLVCFQHTSSVVEVRFYPSVIFIFFVKSWPRLAMYVRLYFYL